MHKVRSALMVQKPFVQHVAGMQLVSTTQLLVECPGRGRAHRREDTRRYGKGGYEKIREEKRKEEQKDVGR